MKIYVKKMKQKQKKSVFGLWVGIFLVTLTLLESGPQFLLYHPALPSFGIIKAEPVNTSSFQTSRYSFYPTIQRKSEQVIK